MSRSTEQILADLVGRMENRFYGKYRGIVRDNADPEKLGRLRMQVPSVLGPDVLTGWATPCVPYGGTPGTGMQFLPEAGAGVWVEFEEGDLEFPLWVGTFWSGPGQQTEMPPTTAADGSVDPRDRGRPEPKIIRTAKGHTVQLDDTDRAEKVTVVDGAHGHVITLDGHGVTVRDGLSGHRVVLGPSGVRIEDGLHEGNRITMDQAGTTVSDAHGHTITLGAPGVRLGAGAAEALVLGTTFQQLVTVFSTAVAAHVHPLPGKPADPPILPLMVPLSLQNATT